MMQYFAVADVARNLGRSPRTIRDWIQSGCPVPDGRRIRLGAVKMGRTWSVPEEELVLFLHRIRPRSGGRPDPIEEEAPP